MSLVTPTTQDISDNIIAQLETTLNQTIPLLPKSFLRVLAKALAGVFIILYKYAGFTFQQLFVSTASDQETEVNGVILVPLTEWGRLLGVGDPAAATQAEMTIDITVENQVGTLPSGTQLINSGNGVTYITIGDVALSAATVVATIRASADQSGGGGAGEIGNLQVGATVSFANPLANVNRNALVASIVVTGADGESTEAYRDRVVTDFQARPQGGALIDYKSWAEEPAGVLTAFPYTDGGCPGQVKVYIESATETDGIPTTPQLQEALDSIDLDVTGLASRRPANALANTFAIARLSFEVEVNGLEVSNSAEVQTDIIAAVEEFLLDREPYLPGVSSLPRKDQIFRSGVEGVVEDIVSAAGGIFTSVTMIKDALPTSAYTLGEGEKAKASTVTFIV
jgi:uncharacterized phage protein gp47/JayE